MIPKPSDLKAAAQSAVDAAQSAVEMTQAVASGALRIPPASVQLAAQVPDLLSALEGGVAESREAAIALGRLGMKKLPEVSAPTTLTALVAQLRRVEPEPRQAPRPSPWRVSAPRSCPTPPTQTSPNAK